MTVHNSEIASIFDKVADLLEIEGANAFRVRAYRKAAQAVGTMPRSLADMVKSGEDLSKLPAIGHDLADKIAEITRTGHLRMLEEVERRTPGDLAELMDLPGLGPKRVHALQEMLGITGIDDLLRAARTGELRKLPGFGPKLQDQIFHTLTTRGSADKRIRLRIAEEIARDLVHHMEAAPGTGRVIVAGSYRRRRETIGDLDILATSTKPVDTMGHFTAYEDVAEVVSKGATRSTVKLRSGMQVDLRVVAEESYGAALQYFTGSKAHNIATRRIAQSAGLKVNEYGVYRGDRQIAGAAEEEVYAALGLPWIPPELREDRGEIDAARKGRLPKSVTRKDVRGDLHVHTNASDGNASIGEMAKAAKALGYEYIAITEHSRRVTVAHGLDEDRLARQIDEIDRLNDSLKGISILKGVEVDILEDGSLDLSDSILRRLDLVLGAAHTSFGLSPEIQTERMLRAMDNPYFTVLAHPTGRLIGRREPLQLDMERLIEGALDRNVILEINGQPDRLDLTDVHARMAKEAGVRIALSTDAHRTSDLDFMAGAVDQARRGWIEAADVVNTRPIKKLRESLRR